MTQYQVAHRDPLQRVGDYERDVTCEELNRHFSEGRLSSDELDLRVDAAVGATTRQDLYVLLRDLPRLTRTTEAAARPPALAPPGINLLVGLLGTSAFLCLNLLLLITIVGFPAGAVLVFLGALGASVSLLCGQHLLRQRSQRRDLAQLNTGTQARYPGVAA